MVEKKLWQEAPDEPTADDRLSDHISPERIQERQSHRFLLCQRANCWSSYAESLLHGNSYWREERWKNPCFRPLESFSRKIHHASLPCSLLTRLQREYTDWKIWRTLGFWPTLFYWWNFQQLGRSRKGDSFVWCFERTSFKILGSNKNSDIQRLWDRWLDDDLVQRMLWHL